MIIKKGKRMKKKLFICLIVVVLFFCSLKLLDFKLSFTEFYLEYGDSFDDITLKDFKEKSVRLPSTNKSYKLVFLLSKECRSCIEKLSLINRIEKIFSDDLLDTFIIWKNKPVLEQIDKNNLSREINFTLDKVNINTSTPTYYLLDKNNKIVFTNTEVEKLISKLLSLNELNKNKIKKNSNKFISNEFKKFEEEKPILVYFAMEGCSDCEASISIIEDNEIQQKCNFLTIYDSNSTTGDGKIIDEGGLFKQIYNIEWYPSFLVFTNEEYQFIGEIEINSLKNKLLSYLIN